MLGGSFDGARTRLAEVEGDASPTQVRLICATARNQQLRHGRKTEDPQADRNLDDGGISILLDAQRLPKAGNGDQRAASVTTAYAAGRKATEDLRLEYQNEGDEWPRDRPHGRTDR